MKKILLAIGLLFHFAVIGQVQHLNLGQEESLNQFVETMNAFSPKNHPGSGSKQQLVWKSQDNLYLYGNGNLAFDYGNSSFWVYNLTIRQWKCLQANEVAVNFGTKGVFSNTNTPGKRCQSTTFTDSSGNLYLMGGTYINSNSSSVEFNDLWKFDIALQQWAWIGGYNTHSAGVAGNSGPLGTESALYFPSTRNFTKPVLAADGTVYFYGGHAPSGDGYDKFDLWKYNPANNAWTLVYKPANNTQNVGTIGVEDPANRPGCLMQYTSWFYNNSLWFYGGSSTTSTDDTAVQKKVWKYNLTTQRWTCMKDPATTDAVYGQQNVSSAANTPPSLINMSNAVVVNDEAYFFGGYELGGNTSTERNREQHNSLWKYNMPTNQWTWLKGKQLTKHPGFLGKKGIERAENMPSSRTHVFLWTDGNAALQLFGGRPYQSTGGAVSQEFWKYNIATNNFTWTAGLSFRYDHLNQDSTHYFEDLTTPLVYNIVQPTNLKWGEKGSKLWFISRLNNQPFLGVQPLGGMFEYDVASSTCHKIKDFVSTPYNYGVYGQMNVADVANVPPYRDGGCLWETDTHLYLMSGYGVVGNYYHYNDFWKFDKTTKNWTWINGAKNNDAPYSSYGAIGVANPANYPKSRRDAQTWVAADGTLWLFSGINSDNQYLTDFWKYDPVANIWTLMGGNANNGTTNITHFTDTYPPFVQAAATWSKGNDLYFYGGNGLGKAGNNLNTGLLSDIWKYEVATNTWSRLSGNRKIGMNASYGVKEYGFITNLPGARKDYPSWSDDHGNLWLYGGFGKGSSGSGEKFLFDLWKYDLTLNNWIWMGGLDDQANWTDPVFDADDYIFPKRTAAYSVTYKGNGKYYLASGLNNNLYEFDFSSYQRDYNTIEGTARFDNNNNCDANDAVVPNVKLEINALAQNHFYTNLNGHYKIHTPVLNNTLAAVGLAENSSFFNISPASVAINFTGFNGTQLQNFCVSPNGSHADVEVVVIPMGNARPGFNSIYKIIYKNKGNSSVSGTLQFNYDENIHDYVSASVVPASQSAGNLQWSYTNLIPFESRNMLVTLNLNSTIEIPAVNAGDVISLSAAIPLTGDENTTDNTFTLAQLVVNAIDPNDKICLQGNSLPATVAGAYVTYKIRFENSGTARAQNVVVKDFINPAQFDIQSISTIDASHQYRKLITADNHLEYHFENINLPFDDANNDGYVVFKIRTKASLVAGDTFTNGAGIYFDYNAPVTTNNYTTTLTALGLDGNIIENSVTAYPNPVKQLLHFKTATPVLKIEVYDLAGRLVLAQSVKENMVDLATLKNGSYLVKLQLEDKTIGTKIIKD